MSQVQPDIDLAPLARSETAIPRPRRSALRWLLPLLVVAAFGAVLFSTVPGLFERARSVTVVRPRAISAASPARAGAVVVQAAGWIEADPFPLEVAALTLGVVEEVLVQEGDAVEAGQVVARIVVDDAKLALAEAEAELARAAAEARGAAAELELANARFAAALEVTEAERTARANLAGKRAAAGHRAAAVRQGEARVRVAESELVVQRELSAAGAGGTRQVELAEARLEEEVALVELLEADAALAAAEAEAAAATHARAAAELEQRFAERLALAAAEARTAIAQAEVERGEALHARAALALERCAVRAPRAGVVLERRAQPGSAAGTICTVYDPSALRVRVDVPLADLARLTVGQPAEILAGTRPEAPYRGELARIVELADIQKVTLEAQVRVLEPDRLLRPDMLVQVRFLGAPRGPGSDDGAAPRAGVLVPTRLWTPEGVWVVDREGRAARRVIERGGEEGEWVQVLSGLELTDKLIDDGRAGLAPGVRVRVQEGS